MIQQMIEMQRPSGRPDRQYYLGLAHSGLRMPIGTDLVLHEHADAGEIVLDGHRLGQVSEKRPGVTERLWRCP